MYVSSTATKTTPQMGVFQRPVKKIILGALALLAFAPDAVFSMPWSWDMFKQPNHRAQKERAPDSPAGVVSTDGKPYFAKDRTEAERLKNPFPADKASIEIGRVKYGTYCATCHGDGGKGDGVVGQKYVAPTDLTSDYVQKKPDGDIYYTVTNGGLAIMPSYRDSVPVEDRWHIINYIKAVLGRQ